MTVGWQAVPPALFNYWNRANQTSRHGVSLAVIFLALLAGLTGIGWLVLALPRLAEWLGFIDRPQRHEAPAALAVNWHEEVPS